MGSMEKANHNSGSYFLLFCSWKDAETPSELYLGSEER